MVTQLTAQVTTGTIYGRITDPSGGVMPGVVINAVAAETGIPRTATTDTNGTFRLPALPNGTYKVTTEMSGFRPAVAVIQVSVSANVQLDVKLELATKNEEVNVEATAPRYSGRVLLSPIGRLIDLPSQGLQLAGLAATLPGVGLGFHSDSSRAAQQVLQVGGAGGRNGNMQVDGGDNNDGTVGGPAHPIPLAAIEQFSLVASGADAQFGQASSVLNIVTKSGTNQTRGSVFTFFRDDALNAQTFSEKRVNADKQEYGRVQYGGSLGGPVVQNKAHYFAAFERNRLRGAADHAIVVVAAIDLRAAIPAA